MKLLRLGLASSAVLSLMAFSHGCANNSDDCAYTADCSGSSAAKGGSGGTTADGGTTGGGESGSDGTGGTSGSGGSQAGGNGGSGGESCDSSKSPSEEPCLLETNEFGVFVSPLGDAEGDGTKEKPYATLSAAILSAKAAGKPVFACASEGAYEEPLQIGESGDGTRLYGGFSCDEWKYDAETRTVVQSPTSTGLRVSDLVDGLLIEDFEIIASDATQPGQSSMGAFVTNSENVAFTRVNLTAGDGADGEEGAGTMDPASAGEPGSEGHPACSVSPNFGGAQVVTKCGGVATESVGGLGGNGEGPSLNAGAGAPGSPDGGGAGGLGQNDGTWSCSSTQGGADAGDGGQNGAHAEGASGIGSLAAVGYISSAGGNGGTGSVGYGGGGGGGVWAPTVTNPCGDNVPATGASGGSGGGGGCGGDGGKGGKGGGASFALALVNSVVTLSSAELIAGSGGDGGDGGYGQPGGLGGLPGAAASGAAGSKASCAGGPGGQGGNGGHGGGGIGGPSVGIAYVGDEPVQMNVDIKVAPVPAQGGLDGAGETTGAGDNGLVQKKQAFPSN